MHSVTELPCILHVRCHPSIRCCRLPVLHLYTITWDVCISLFASTQPLSRHVWGWVLGGSGTLAHANPSFARLHTC
jgi:hypothetical protein